MGKKVLFISNRGWFMGGGEHSFLDLVPRLKSAFEPVVLVPETGDLHQRIVSLGVSSVVLPLPALRFGNAAACVSTLVRLIGILKREAICLVYSNGSRPALYGGIAGRILRIPVVWHCRVGGRDKWLDWVLRCLCSTIITNSHATANRFRGLPGAPVVTIYNGIDLGKITAVKDIGNFEVPSEWRVILHCARISRSKRQDLSIDAFEKIASVHPDYHLIFIGQEDTDDLSWAQTLYEKSRRSCFSARIHWLGGVEAPGAWMIRSEILLFPCEAEGFGRVIVEAMACGCVPIGVRSGGVTEIINDGINGLAAEKGSARSLAKSLDFLISNSDTYAKLRANAIERANDFSLSRHVKETSDLMLSVCQDRLP